VFLQNHYSVIIQSFIQVGRQWIEEGPTR